MIRAALVRGAIACKRVDQLGRTLNRELWMIGYLARLEIDVSDRTVVVEVRKSL